MPVPVVCAGDVAESERCQIDINEISPGEVESLVDRSDKGGSGMDDHGPFLQHILFRIEQLGVVPFRRNFRRTPARRKADRELEGKGKNL